MSLNHQDVKTEDQASVSVAAVREQLERLVGSTPFNHSRRFPTFLRFVVEHALNGTSDQLKERTIGIEVFGRGAEYDTASDPIVRVTAAEIRKRIAQYYAIPGHQDQLRLSLPSGSYVPQFHWPLPASHESSTDPQLPNEVLPLAGTRSPLLRFTLLLSGF